MVTAEVDVEDVMGWVVLVVVVVPPPTEVPDPIDMREALVYPAVEAEATQVPATVFCEL